MCVRIASSSRLIYKDFFVQEQDLNRITYSAELRNSLGQEFSSRNNHGRSRGLHIIIWVEKAQRVSLGVTVRLLHCDLEVTGSNPENSLFACWGKAAYIEPSPGPAMARASCARQKGRLIYVLAKQLNKRKAKWGCLVDMNMADQSYNFLCLGK